ncbi:UPF0605 protein CG18335-like [Chelonus insularis]|uniref:UPF0605 protein CG18335-like n=1 Tax=Chelonus insularis TaxID=460826 RepID=UPI00158A2C38|nr:UPF0605 protein CG18335-like [Chelonus insularis]
MATVSLLTTSQPHLIPGYTGFCPQYRYRCGKTYGNLTHELLLDPTINYPKSLIDTKRTKNLIRPTEDDIKIVNSRVKRRNAVYEHPMVPGYQGFIPNLNARLGQRCSVMATEGLADFERKQLKDRAALKYLKMIIARQRGLTEPGNFEERSHPETESKLPLITAHPAYATMMRDQSIKETLEVAEDNFKNLSISLYSPGLKESNKCMPFCDAQTNLSPVSTTNNILCDFTSNYRIRQNTEWTPATISRSDPPYLIQSTEIYHKHVGLIPNYLGHVPGIAFRHGKTFGADTRDAKRRLHRNNYI